MSTILSPELAQIVSKARETWQLGDYDVIASAATTRPAASLVRFAGLAPGQRVLDVATGTGVVAITAARAGARVVGLDLAPDLLAKARRHASIAGADSIEFVEGDAQEMRFADGSFDVVVSQFGHMFAPDPARTVAEMLRVLRPGGRIAFATWPPELFTGRMFALNGKHVPPPQSAAPPPPTRSPEAPLGPGGTGGSVGPPEPRFRKDGKEASPPSPPLWGDPNVVKERLGTGVKDLVFRRDATFFAVPSPSHFRAILEATYGPTMRIVQALEKDPARLAAWRAEFDALTAQYFDDNAVRQDYLLTRATKV